MEQMDIKFYVKERKSEISTGDDVTITLSRRTDKKDFILFTFRNEVEELIAPETKHFGVGVYGTRLYFKEYPKRVGYIMAKNSRNKTSNHYGKIPIESNENPLRSLIEKGEGSYKLLYDKDAKLFYIETGITFFTKEGIS